MAPPRARCEPFEGGVRRHWPGTPRHLPHGRDPGLVREVLRRGGDRVVDAASRIGSWVHLMALAEAGWLGPERASARIALVETGERLCRLAQAMCDAEELLARPVGTAALVSGVVAGAPACPGQRTIWECRQQAFSYDEFFAAEDPWPLPEEPIFLETAYDFEVGSPAGAPVLVAVDGAYLVGAKCLAVGDRVLVVGFVEERVDPAGLRRGPRELPVRPILRAGASLPLLVLCDPAAAALHGPQRTDSDSPS